MQSSQKPSLGPLVRLRSLPVSALPPHPTLSSYQTQASSQTSGQQQHSPGQFARAILDEAETFMTGYLPSKFQKKSTKKAPPATAEVDVSAYEMSASEASAAIRSSSSPSIATASTSTEGGASGSGGSTASADQGQAENWFARTSIHPNKAESGTASWDEFLSGLMANHSVHEMEYTPDVFDANKVLEWSSAELETEGTTATDGGVEGEAGGRWQEVGMAVYEMAHHIPPPLNNRVFSVLVVTARSSTSSASAIPASTSTAAPSLPQATEPSAIDSTNHTHQGTTAAGSSKSPSFLVVQIPITLTSVKESLYSSGNHKVHSDAQKKKPIQLGEYVSIERCEFDSSTDKTTWQMATASDAKGYLPMAVQKMALPGAVVKDVGFFMDWIQGQRRKGTGQV